jgi:hypothetical protein
MPFEDLKEGQTHYYGDGCIPPHKPLTQEKPEQLEERAYQKGRDDANNEWYKKMSELKERAEVMKKEAYDQGSIDRHKQDHETREIIIQEAIEEYKKELIGWAEKIKDDKDISNGYYNAMDDLISKLNQDDKTT